MVFAPCVCNAAGTVGEFLFRRCERLSFDLRRRTVVSAYDLNGTPGRLHYEAQIDDKYVVSDTLSVWRGLRS